MPFPSIHTCIICEEVREEKRKLLSLLGLYGTTPDVEILVRDFSVPVRLSFIFLGRNAEGRFKVAPQVIDPDGGIVLDSPGVEMSIPEPALHYQFGIGGASVRLPRAGRYTLVLRVDDQTHYQTTFDVRQGKPEDFV